MKAVIVSSIYVLVPYIINFIFIKVLVFFKKDLSFGISLALMIVITSIVLIYVVMICGSILQNKNYINDNKIIQTVRKRDITNVFFIMMGFILIRQGLLYEFLNKFKGPVTKENIEIICNNLTGIQLSITVLILMIQMIVIAPIFEELFFRGIIFRGILNKYSGCYKKAIIYSSIIFGVAHLNIPQGVNAIIAGIILSSIYYHTNSIKLSIFAHFLNNFFIFLPNPNILFTKLIYVLIGTCLIYKGIRLFKDRAAFNISKN